MTGSTLGVMPRLSGARVLVLNWRDTRHPEAGGAEQYMHQIARRWVSQGVRVTWLTARPEGLAAHEVIDGIEIIRFGGPLSLYPLTALWLLRTRGKFDAVVDCQNGIPFFSPLFAGAGVPVVQVVHHVHQDQFSTRFSPPMAAVGRFLEGRMARWVYGSRAIVAVSPSTRLELRRRLGFRGPIFVVPNGTIDVPTLRGSRELDPTIVVVSRLVPHKRIDLLLGQIAVVAGRIPRLRVDIVGDGPERSRLQNLALDLGLQTIVTFHGYQCTEVRDNLLSRAWVTTSTAAAEGWGCSVIEAAAWGVPCVALNVPGICDSVLHGRTGWLVQRAQDFGAVLIAALAELADKDRAQEMTADCQQWARCFSWDRSAELLAGVLLTPAAVVTARRTGFAERRYARSDIGTLVRFSSPRGVDLRAVLRSTDEIVAHGETISMLLRGCDEFDAAAVLHRLGVFGAELRLTGRHDLLAGPAAASIPVSGDGFSSARLA
jgi:glycosyltransferase involved in cell wall biosynthesis